ncbi:hypothetical protein DM02DRAFT_732654 [Periconia macrospinosa]|uniref:Uncharacterized protein n=1 Tax=Periconia macrospinosa TaxID=97972 RepID=A0A2V1D9K5_9PLEO|nr:hypothetical protein DM02DRAFT_732654 [Periconia macrospinosa]
MESSTLALSTTEPSFTGDLDSDYKLGLYNYRGNQESSSESDSESDHEENFQIISDEVILEKPIQLENRDNLPHAAGFENPIVEVGRSGPSSMLMPVVEGKHNQFVASHMGVTWVLTAWIGSRTQKCQYLVELHSRNPEYRPFICTLVDRDRLPPELRTNIPEVPHLRTLARSEEGRKRGTIGEILHWVWNGHERGLFARNPVWDKWTDKASIAKINDELLREASNLFCCVRWRDTAATWESGAQMIEKLSLPMLLRMWPLAVNKTQLKWKRLQESANTWTDERIFQDNEGEEVRSLRNALKDMPI